METPTALSALDSTERIVIIAALDTIRARLDDLLAGDWSMNYVRSELADLSNRAADALRASAAD